MKSLCFSKNQADLQNACILQKNRRTIESLRALKFLRLVRKPAGPGKNWPPAYCLGSVESPAADFLLVWLKSSLSDPRRCDESLMQSPSEETAQSALLLWAALSCTVPAVCTGLPCQEMVQIHVATKSQAAAWNSSDSCQNTAVPNSAV